MMSSCGDGSVGELGTITAARVSIDELSWMKSEVIEEKVA